MKLTALILIFLGIGCSDGARILCFFPVPSHSVVIIAHQLMAELAERGHEITMVSPFPYPKKHPNFRDVVITVDAGHSLLGQAVVNRQKQKNPVSHFQKVIKMSMDAVKETLQHPDFKKIMAEESFDLVVTSFFFATFQQGVAAHFKCPYLILSSINTGLLMNEMIGQPANPEAAPNFFAGFTGSMTMWQRVVNLFATGAEFLFKIYTDRKNLEAYK